jgi:hypothetical protein
MMYGGVLPHAIYFDPVVLIPGAAWNLVVKLNSIRVDPQIAEGTTPFLPHPHFNLASFVLSQAFCCGHIADLFPIREGLDRFSLAAGRSLAGEH